MKICQDGGALFVFDVGALASLKGFAVASEHVLMQMYRTLREAFGPQNWWPAQTPFEVMLGAVLTQNTNWKNVEKAMGNLRRRGALSVSGLRELGAEELQSLIRPAGYFRQKSARLQALAQWVDRKCGGEIDLLRERPLEELREELIALRGIGPETADSILLYALEKPVFVVDAYTKRVMARHGFVALDCSYFELQSFCEHELPRDVELYKDFHAQIVELGKRVCRRAPRCNECPVHDLLGGPILEENEQ